MKTLTIKQPYASLIMAGIKKYEFRTWKTNYRGKFLIHAGKSVDKKAMEKYKQYKLNYPTGSIIGIATLVDCIKITDIERETLKEKNPFVYSNVINNKEWVGYGFKLDNIKEVNPIKTNGKLGFWEFSYTDINSDNNEFTE